MTVDIRTLGFRADTSDLKRAKTDLEGLTGAAYKTGAAAEGVGDSVKDAGAAMSASGRYVRVMSKETREAAANFKQLQISAINGRKVIRQAGDEMDRTGRATQQANRAMNSMNLRQPMLQLSQVAQQGSATGNYLQALAIQLPDLTLAFGPLGIAAGVAAGALLPFAANLLTSGGNAEEAEEALDSYTSALDRYMGYAETAVTSTKELREEFGSFANDIRDQAIFLSRISAADALRGLNAQEITGEIQEALRSVDAIEAARANLRTTTEQMEAGVPGVTSQTVQLMQEALDTAEAKAQDVADKLGLSVKQVTELGPLIKDLNAADSLEGAARIAGDIIEKVEDWTDGTVDLKENLSSFLSSMYEVSRETAAAAVAMEGVEDAADGIVGADLEGVMKNVSAASQTFADQVERALEAVQGMTGANLQGVFSGVSGLFGDFKAVAGGAGLRDLIARAEGTAAGSNARAREYNTTLDYGEWTGGPRNLVGMTLDKILELQSEMLANPANRERYVGPDGSRGSSALGRYQITRRTLLGLIDELNIDPSTTRFDQRTQDRFADQLIRRRQGQGVEGFRQEWQGLQNVPAGLIERANSNVTTLPVDPEVDAAAQKAMNKALAEADRAAKEAAKSAKDHAQEVENSEAAFDGLMGSMDPVVAAHQEYEQALEKIDLALKNEVISQQEAAKARTLAKQSLTDTLQDIKDGLAGEDLESITEGLDGIAGALTDVIFEAESFDDAMGIMGNAVKRIAATIIESNILGHLEALAGGAGGGGGGNILTNILGAVAGAGGGSGGGGGPTRPVARPRAGGGNVYPGEWYSLAERGPELYTPASAGHITPNSALPENKPMEVVVRHEGVQVREEQGEPGQPPRLVVERMVNDVLSSGRADKTMGARFGVRPRPTGGR